MKDIAVFRRGQVWFVKEDIESGKGSIQCKSRPFLVVSNDACNSSSSVIHMAPITSKDKKPLPTHVVYYDYLGSKGTVLLEQVITKSVPHIMRGTRYMYTLSDDIMEKVDHAIMEQFSLIHYKEEKKSSCVDSPEYEEALAEVAVSEEALEDSEEEESPSRVSQIEKFNNRVSKYKEMNGIEVAIERTPKGRIRWTPELREQLISDAARYTEEYVLSKYEMKKETYRTTLSKFKHSK